MGIFEAFGTQAAQVALRVATVAVLSGLIAAICWSDLRHRRIPNRLVAAGLAVALAYHGLALGGAGLFDYYSHGGIGLRSAALGAALGFGGFLVLHAAGAVGAGDVKLMAMLGAVFGATALPKLALLIFLSGGLLVAVRIIDRERRRAVFANLRLIAFAQIAAISGGVGPRFDPRTDTAHRMPFAIPMALGAIALAAAQWGFGS
ncbi:MAG TPA: A24 family peptidase [Burkholderiaceae bacterium]|nr:A24 family peptidase [Burkholderiaceae bacterium]